MENGNLFIEQISKKYEATYLCQARNDYGSVEMRTTLQIKSVKAKPPPIISYGPQNQTIALNSQALLECKVVSSDSKPTFVWYKNGNQITAKEYQWGKFNLEETGSLVINALQTYVSKYEFVCVKRSFRIYFNSIGLIVDCINAWCRILTERRYHHQRN